MTERMSIKVEDQLKYNCIRLIQPPKFVNVADSEGKSKPKIAKGLINDADPKDDKISIEKHEIMIVITLYDEQPLLFNKTMCAIHKNVESFIKKQIENEKIGVCVIVDGIESFYKVIHKLEENKDVNKDYYNSIFKIEDIYNYFGVDLKNEKRFEKLLGKEITCEDLDNEEIDKLQYEKIVEFAHLFTCKAKFDLSLESHINLYFCVKHKNKRKLNSHFWFFGGFCTIANPEYCILIDAGTEPQEEALYFFYEAFKNDENIAGVCGEIIPKNENDSIFDILCYAQKVEYKFAHILDKALESITGFITVLPGAFSAYRYEALDPNNEKGPLWGDYFKSILNPHLMDCYHSNIYLAEDRVLCISLVSAKKHQHLLKYVRESVAYTDPPSDFEQLTNQRRRWINGSWFALLDSLTKFHNIILSEHHLFRKCIFMLQMLYYTINIAYSFVLVGGFWLALSICIRRLFGRSYNGNVSTTSDLDTFMSGLLVGYIALLVATLVISLGSKIKDANFALKVISIFLACYMALFIGLMIKLFYNNWSQSTVLVPVLITVLGFFFILAVNKAVWSVLIGSLHFLLATPIYVNIFTIYAICNIHDVSWGNRLHDLTKEEQEQMDENEKFRTGWTLLWAFINFYFAYALDAADQSNTAYAKYIYWVGIVGMSMIYIRFLGGFANFFKQLCCKYTCSDKGEQNSIKIEPNSSDDRNFLIKSA